MMSAAQKRPIGILLVEDNPNDVELMLHALQHCRIANQIEVVRDGAEALDRLFGEGAYAGRDFGIMPRVVLLDLELPKVSGIEVLERIKTDPRTRTISVVVFTSSDDDWDVARCYSLGANSFIVKPVDFEKLTESVRQIELYWLLLNTPPSQGA